MNNGFIKLHRKILNWEWYDDSNTFRLFIHFLLKANHKEKKWRGKTINRGSFVTSYEKLSSETKMSVRNVRTSIKRLISTCEVTKSSSNKFTVITVNNYDDYQTSDKQSDKQATSKRQASDKQVTTTKNEKNDKNVKNVKKETYIVNDKSSTCPHQEIIKLYHEILPELPEVKLWTEQRQRLLRNRWKQNKEFQSLVFWENYFYLVRESDFLMGKTEKPFTPNLEWLIRPKNFPKVLEGNYTNKNSKDDQLRRLMKKYKEEEDK